MSSINARGVYDTLDFHGVPHDVRQRVSKVLEEHGHRGREVVMDELRQLPEAEQLNNRHLRHVEEAIEKHTSEI